MYWQVLSSKTPYQARLLKLLFVWSCWWRRSSTSPNNRGGSNHFIHFSCPIIMIQTICILYAPSLYIISFTWSADCYCFDGVFVAFCFVFVIVILHHYCIFLLLLISLFFLCQVGAVGCALGCSPLAKLLPLKIKVSHSKVSSSKVSNSKLSFKTWHRLCPGLVGIGYWPRLEGSAW